MSNEKINRAASLALFDLQRYKDFLSGSVYGGDYPENVMPAIKHLRETYQKKFSDLCSALRFAFTIAELNEKIEWHVERF